MRPGCLLTISMLFVTALSETVYGQPNLRSGECDAIKKIVDHANDDFKMLKKGSPSDGKWNISASLPGYRACFVQHRDRATFVCEGPITRSKPAAVSQRDAKLNALSSCLGQSWTKMTKMSEFFVSLQDLDGSRALMLAVDNVSPFPEYFVRLSVFRSKDVPSN